MKEISLQDLLNLADASAHDGICDFWNQKTIHYLVVFTSTQDDFEIIGVGPALPCATLEDAEHHVIPGKKPEFYIKCPAAVMKRLEPKLAPSGMIQPMPSMKGRTTVPFARIEPQSSPPPAVPRATAPGLKLESPRLKPAAPASATAAPFEAPRPQPEAAPALSDENRQLLQNYQERLAALEAREHALAGREQALAARQQQAQAFLDEAEKKQAALAELTAQLQEQQAYVAQNEEKLLAKMHAHQERAAEVDQIGEELRRKSHEIQAAEKKLQNLEARSAELDRRQAELDAVAAQLQEREAFVTASENRLIEQGNQLAEKQDLLAHQTEEHEKKHLPRASSNTRVALKSVVA
jgi:hypothetical protein